MVFIDQKDHYEYVPGSIKSASDNTWHDKFQILYKDAVAGYKNKFSFIQGRLANVQKDANVIQILQANGRYAQASYDILILCTGFNYEAPIK